MNPIEEENNNIKNNENNELNLETFNSINNNNNNKDDKSNYENENNFILSENNFKSKEENKNLEIEENKIIQEFTERIKTQNEEIILHNNSFSISSLPTINNNLDINKNIDLSSLDSDVKYTTLINQLKNQIIQLENKNILLSKEIETENKKNIDLYNILNNKEKDIENILEKIKKYLKLNKIDEIYPKLTEIINYINNNIDEKNPNNKARDELIKNIENLYRNLTNDKNENIELKILWRWVKHLINNIKKLLNEKEQNEQIYKELLINDIYKNFCVELIDEYNLNNINELKEFIFDLLERNDENRKRELKLKNILFDSDSNNNNM